MNLHEGSDEMGMPEAETDARFAPGPGEITAIELISLGMRASDRTP